MGRNTPGVKDTPKPQIGTSRCAGFVGAPAELRGHTQTSEDSQWEEPWDMDYHENTKENLPSWTIQIRFPAAEALGPAPGPPGSYARRGERNNLHDDGSGHSDSELYETPTQWVEHQLPATEGDSQGNGRHVLVSHLEVERQGSLATLNIMGTKAQLPDPEWDAWTKTPWDGAGADRERNEHKFPPTPGSGRW